MSMLDDNDDAALIGGIVGGVLALILVGGLIAFLVARGQQREKDELELSNASGLQPVPNSSVRSSDVALHDSNYDFGMWR